MTLVELAMFKTFTIDRGMDEMFISLYTKYRLKENPVSIEEYLIKADPANVFMSAFYWVTNSRFGYDYWQDFQRRWDRYRKEKVNEYPMKDVANFKGRGKSLRTNWDNPKFWHVNGRLDTAERYGTELSKDELEQIASEYERVGYDHKTKAYTGTAAKDIRLASRELLKDEEERDILGEFEIIETPKVKTGRRTLGDDEISLNRRNRAGRLTFSQPLTKEIMERGGYEYAAVGKNKKGEIALLLNDSNGVPLNDAPTRDRTSNVAVCNKTLVTQLADMLGIKKDYAVLRLSLLQKTEDYAAYLVTIVREE